MDIPEHAKRTESNYVSMPVDHPFTECEMGHDGVEFYVMGAGGISRTEEFLEWEAKQPLIHRVTYEWTEERD